MPLAVLVDILLQVFEGPDGLVWPSEYLHEASPQDADPIHSYQLPPRVDVFHIRSPERFRKDLA
jgi:hypothetical protein